MLMRKAATNTYSPRAISFECKMKQDTVSYQTDRDVPMASVGASRPPIFSNWQESRSKVSHAARELATVFSVTFRFCFSNNSWSIGQNAPPPNRWCLGTSLQANNNALNFTAYLVSPRLMQHKDQTLQR